MTEKRYASLTQYDGTAACTEQWISQLYAIPKLGKFVRPLFADRVVIDRL